MKREPLIHITQRDNLTAKKGRASVIARNILIYGLALVIALLLCAAMMYAFTGENPLDLYVSFFNGALGTNRRMWETLRNTAILLCIGFAVLPAFRMRYWNTGAEGQVLIGACATAAVMIYGEGLPSYAVYILSPVAGILAGVIWAVIPALFRAKWRTNETLFTLMMNYIATQVVAFCIVYWEDPKGSNSVGLIHAKTRLGWLPSIGGNSSLLVILIVLALMGLMYVYLNCTKQGYEITVVGQSERTAAYAGINTSRVIIRTMAVCGAMAGLTGYLLTAGVAHTISTTIVDGRGFTAIIVAWLGKLNPFIMLLISFLLVFMQRGSTQVAGEYGLNENASDVLSGIILFMILIAEFFIRYQVHFRRKRRDTLSAGEVNKS